LAVDPNDDGSFKRVLREEGLSEDIAEELTEILTSDVFRMLQEPAPYLHCRCAMESKRG